VWDRVLVAMDEFEAGQAALALGAGLARSTGASVVVLHVREVTPLRRGAQLLTSGEAGRLVEEAVTSLRSTGIDATGVLSKVRQNRTARTIVAEAESWGCDAIVLGSARRRGPSRLVGGGIRERVLRRSPATVLTAPSPLRVAARVPAHPPVEAREPQR
jgi:nucleotide-binding universal stress UspA family protein